MSFPLHFCLANFILFPLRCMRQNFANGSRKSIMRMRRIIPNSRIAPNIELMVQYKLYYLDLPGRAEPLRILFHYVGQEFEDVRISREDWPAQKSKFFYGQVPVLEVDGKQLGQSYAISQFLGKKFGLAGKDEWEEAKAAEINMYLNDFGNEMYPYLGITAGVMPGDPEKAREEIFLPGAAKHFPLVEKLLTESGSGFLLPSGLSYVDFSFASLLQGFTEVEPEVMAKYPKMVAFIDRVYGLPQLKAYFSKYPPKDLHNYEKV